MPVVAATIFLDLANMKNLVLNGFVRGNMGEVLVKVVDIQDMARGPDSKRH